MDEQARRTAESYVHELRQTTNLMYEDRIDFEEFRKRQRKTWSEVQAQPQIEREVLRILRGEMPPIARMVAAVESMERTRDARVENDHA